MINKLFFSLLLTLWTLPFTGSAAGIELQFAGERTILLRGGRKVDFKTCLQELLRRHPAMGAEEVMKLCCQTAFGPVSSGDRKNFGTKFAACPPRSGKELFEIVSPDFIKIDPGAWKAAGLPAKWLFNMLPPDRTFKDGEIVFKKYITAAQEVMDGKEGKKFAKLSAALSAAPQLAGKYRNTTENSGCLISIRFLNALPVLKRTAALPDKKVRIVAIDGRAASGKTTLSRQLAAIWETDAIHMDDFFLPLEMRTPERYNTPGGNVHYERFIQEVLPHLGKTEAFSYRKFDCSVKKLGDRVKVRQADIRIVEGAYSLHPAFGNYADLKIFYHVPPEEQMRRITLRNGKNAARMFKERWIPLEELYIKNCSPAERADLIIGGRDSR